MQFEVVGNFDQIKTEEILCLGNLNLLITVREGAILKKFVNFLKFCLAFSYATFVILG